MIAFKVLLVVAMISSRAMAAPADKVVTDLQAEEGTTDLEAAGSHPSAYGGLGYGGYGGYGHGGYGGYGHGGYGGYGGYNHGGYGRRYGNSYGTSGYTSINKVISHNSHGHAGGSENGGYGAGSYGAGYYKK